MQAFCLAERPSENGRLMFSDGLITNVNDIFVSDDRNRRRDFRCEFQRCLRLEYAKSSTFNNVICD